MSITRTVCVLNMKGTKISVKTIVKVVNFLWHKFGKYVIVQRVFRNNIYVAMVMVLVKCLIKSICGENELGKMRLHNV